MKCSRTKSRKRLKGLTIFAGEKPESYDDLKHRAEEKIRHLKESCREEHLVFEYNGELVRGRFIDAVEGDFPGTFMTVLRLASSRICHGPCVVRLEGERINGIVVTGKGGMVGITAKALPQRRSIRLSREQAELVRCA